MDSDFGLLILITGLIVLLHNPNVVVSEKPQVPCYFIFGDSFFDSGNNNRLETKWKANYPPYGIDFSKGPTGRFTNGRTSADIIGQTLGFDEFIPPYATATDDQISKGVNYASGGAGILDRSGILNGDRISFSQQMLHHNSTVSRISRTQKNTTFLKECIYVINIGTIDYIHNYFWLGDNIGLYNTSRIYTIQGYADVLAVQYYRQLKTLYNLGARKIALFGLPELGCIPFTVEGRWADKQEPCEYVYNDCVFVFNNRMKTLVDGLNKHKSDARFTLINMTSILQPQKGAPASSPSLTPTSKPENIFLPCCPRKDGWQCIPNSVPCPTRVSSTYFDSLHPTEAVNIAIATRSYKALLPTDVYPYDIHHLTQVKL